MRFFDLFAGIGGFRIALEREGYKCVGFCEIDKWAKKLYKAYYNTENEVEYEDATKIIPKELPDFDVLCAGFPCFPEGHLVFTEEGFKDISQVEKGERVLTHKGRFKEVTATMTREYDGELIKISIPVKNGEIKATPEHPFLTVNQISENSFTEPKWKEARELTTNDFLVIQKPLNRNVSVHLESNAVKYPQKGGRTYVKVKEVKKEYYKGRVYNIEVAGDNSYTVNSFVAVHNCQAFSIAGKRRGFEDTRGTLFFEIARIARAKRPTHLLLENVKGLLNHDGGRTFETILKTLDELGYDVEWQVLNSKDFGVPQNRERVFIVGHLRGRSRPKVFPIRESDKVYYEPPKAKKTTHEDSIKKEVALCMLARQQYNLHGTFIAEPVNQTVQVGHVGKTDCQGNRVYSPEGVAPTLCANGGGRGAKTGLYLVYDPYNQSIKGDNVVGTLRTNYSNGNSWIIECNNDTSEISLTELPKGFRIRRLTPLECFRLQGFPDDIYYKAKELGISDTQLYKMTGNAVTVQVVQTIARKLKKDSQNG